MGSTASLSITLSSKAGKYYQPDEIISGHVILRTNKTLNFNYIEIKVIGEMRFLMEGPIYGRDMYGGTTVATHRRLTNFHFESQRILIEKSDGISMEENGFRLQPGTYQFPFSIHLPNDLPPSIVIDDGFPRIDYFVKAKLIHSQFSHDIREKMSILVENPSSPPQCDEPIDSTEVYAQDLTIDGKLKQSYIPVNEPSFGVKINIKNPRQIPVDDIIIKLVRRCLLNPKHISTVILEEHLSEIKDFQNGYSYKLLNIPETASSKSLLPSFKCKDPNNSNLYWAIEYIVAVKLKSKSLPKDIELNLPITVVN